MVTGFPTTDTEGPITLIDTVTVPADEVERVLVRWHDTAAALARCAGFRGADAYRATESGSAAQVITVTRWDDEVALVRAQEDEEVQEAVGRMVGDPELHLTQRTAVYQLATRVAADRT